MALPDYKGTIVFIDRELQEFTRTVFSEAASHGAAVAEIGELVGFLEPLSDCVISRYEVAQVIQNSTDIPVADVDGEIQALFNFRNADGKIRSISIPGFDRSYLLPGTDKVNTTNPDVVAFVNDYKGGTIVDLGAVDITDLKSAVEYFGKKRKNS